MTERNGDHNTGDERQEREVLKPTCEGMADIPEPVEDQEDINGGDTSPSDSSTSQGGLA